MKGRQALGMMVAVGGSHITAGGYITFQHVWIFSGQRQEPQSKAGFGQPGVEYVNCRSGRQ